jgi:GntR family transcriptional repressor for pyruvate dehydrogenase complex
MAQGATDAILSPVLTPTMLEGTVERLGTAIRSGVLPPGHRLPSERELADQLRISRSTLRQALGALAESGHLVAQRGRGGGTFVAARPPLSAGSGSGGLPADWRDRLAVRRAFEVGVACLAAEAAGAAPEACAPGVAAVRAQIEAMERAPDFPAYRRADVALHVGLAELTGVRALVLRATELQAGTSELLAHIAHPTAVLAHSNDDHARIVAAVERGDVPGAIDTVRHHLAGTEHVLNGLAPS